MRQLTVDQDTRAVRTQSRPPVAWIWAGIILVMAIVVAVVYWTITLPKDAGFGSPLSVTVPDVSGKTYADATAELLKLKLVPESQSQTDPKVAAGKVIKTDPAAGIQVGTQQIVTVYVSLGAPTVSVPNLSGLTAAGAKTQLQAIGLTLGNTTRQDSPTLAKGLVISSVPSSATAVTPLSSVDIIVSTGMVAVPSVVGDTSTDAGSQLRALQLDVTVKTDNTCTGGKVTSQSLPAGSQPQRSKITITVCTG